MQEIRFDDVTTLQQRVGEPWSPWGTEVTVTQDMINRFADVTFDHQWIHIDVERAQKESPLKTTIAHGFFVLSLVPHLRQRSDMQVVGYRNVLNYGADKLRFIGPVPAGSVLHARCRVVAVDAKPKGTLVTEEIEIAVVGQERPALTYTMLMLFQP